MLRRCPITVESGEQELRGEAPDRGGILSDDRYGWIQKIGRAGLGARFTFLSDSDRRYLDVLGLRETTDTVHHPYLPAAFTLFPDMRIHNSYNGYWYWGRPTHEELRQDMRAITRAIRPDWEPPR